VVAQGGGNTFHITGQLKNLQAARVYLIYISDNKQVLDSTTVTNGAYSFTGEITDGGPATLLDVAPRSRPAPRDIARIYLSPESSAISHVDSFSNAVITGSAANTVGSIPQNFLIDPQGKIVGKRLRGDELEKKLSEIYKN
jgi:hypothetical protein